MKPITAQLDPYRIGIAQRGLEVTKVYGRQIANPKNLKSGADTIVEHLVKDYPTHAFVIDREEASTLFQNVDGFSDAEQKLFDQLRSRLIRPSDDPFIVNFASLLPCEASNSDQEKEYADSKQPNRETSPSSEGQPIHAASRKKSNGRRSPTSGEGEPSEATADDISRTRVQ
jgi:hypothetical protein